MLTISAPPDQPISIGQVAAALGIPSFKVRDLIHRGFISDPPRFRRFRLFRVGDIETIRAAAQRAGYISADASEGKA